MSAEKYLIVNADDFGYYDCVSKGILNAADVGTVTATGIFANSPFIETHLAWLQQSKSLDIGVHLNLTHRSPITPEMQARLHRWQGKFPGKFTMAQWILTGRIPTHVVVKELRAQIERCHVGDIHLSFLNSHEHLHMLPPLFRITQDLAVEYNIPHVRYAMPDVVTSLSPGPLVRDLALRILSRKNRKLIQSPVLPFLGMGSSGKLDISYLAKNLSGLTPGVYELMCHPGACDREDETDPLLRAYHDWKSELNTLTSEDFRILCCQENIKLIGYRHIIIDNGQIKIRIDSQ